MTTAELAIVAGVGVGAWWLWNNQRQPATPAVVQPTQPGFCDKMLAVGGAFAGAYAGGPGGAQLGASGAGAVGCDRFKTLAKGEYKAAKEVLIAPVRDLARLAKGGGDGILGAGVNCSVAQKPGNALWCRTKFGLASAPGSDAWARANGQRPLLTGRGST